MHGSTGQQTVEQEHSCVDSARFARRGRVVGVKGGDVNAGRRIAESHRGSGIENNVSMTNV